MRTFGTSCWTRPSKQTVEPRDAGRTPGAVRKVQLVKEKKNMRKTFSTFVFLRMAGALLAALTATPAFGQAVVRIDDPAVYEMLYRQKHEVRVDTPQVECFYEYTAVDTILNQTALAQTLLQVGAAWTKFQQYYAYWTDSVCWRSDWKIKYGEFLRLNPRPAETTFYESQLRNRAGGDITCMGHFGMDYYLYVDSTAQFRWTLTADTATVCGYPCRKATARFRGRQWEAWYTEELPVDAGPWKFSGLPGLILRARTADGLLMFEAVGLRRPGAYYIARTLPQRGDHQPTREEVLEMERNVSLMTEQFLRSKVKSIRTSPGKRLPQRMFYQPLELE